MEMRCASTMMNTRKYNNPTKYKVCDLQKGKEQILQGYEVSTKVNTGRQSG